MSLLAEKLAPLWSAINRLQARQMSIFPATVTSIDPVRIRIDGEERSLAASPEVGVPIDLGSRVRVLRYGTSHLVIARVDPHTGTVPPLNTNRFTRSLRWSRTGNLVTLIGQPFCEVDSPLNPGAYWSLYQLPPSLRPVRNEVRTLAVSGRNGLQNHGAFLIAAVPSGGVRIYETDPSGFRIVAGTSYHFSMSYEVTR